MATSRSLFEVDPKGLAKILEQRGKGFAVVELISNAWDTNATKVDVELQWLGKGLAKLEVTDDDPEGFADLSHAYTLFAESKRAAVAETRGRFNLGEKLVIALCQTATIQTTTGTVHFDENGRRETRTKRDKGSVFQGYIRMTRQELDDALALLDRLIVPYGVDFTVNCVPALRREPIATFEVTLPTVLADENGSLRPTARKTGVDVYRPLPGTAAALYELGVPVVETGDAFDIDIQQKVPLNMERDNVTPSYLRAVRVFVLNETFAELTKEEANAAWVGQALEDDRVTAEAVDCIITHRYGENRVIYDPSDPEGTKLAVAKGFTVIPPGALNKKQWANVKGHDVAKAAHLVTPSPTYLLNQADNVANYLDPDKWDDDIKRVVAYAQRVGKVVLGFEPGVLIANDIQLKVSAMWGARVLTFNRGRLGAAWFRKIGPETDALLLHEFAHHKVHDHLSADYADEVARLGGVLFRAGLEEPSLFEEWRALNG